MKEIPLLFTPANRDLVRRGVKTETRRGDKNLDLVPATARPCPGTKDWYFKQDMETVVTARPRYDCPQREPVRYWMKEPVQVLEIEDSWETDGPVARVLYLDTGIESYQRLTSKDVEKLSRTPLDQRSTSPLFMFKSFTRTWLPGVRVWPEQLGAINQEACFAEGIKALSKDGGKTIKYGLPDADGLPGEAMPWQNWQLWPIDGYRKVWESINGSESWDPEKWVWCIKFEPPAGAA